MVSSRTSGASPLGRKPSANSSPAGLSAVAETMRIGTFGFSSFISLAISVPVLALRKWSAMTKSTGLCLSISRPASPDEAVRTSYPALQSRSLRTRSATPSSSIHKMSRGPGLWNEDVIAHTYPNRKYNAMAARGSSISRGFQQKCAILTSQQIPNCRIMADRRSEDWAGMRAVRNFD